MCFGWGLLCDLAFTLLLGPAVSGWMGGVRPVVPITADCACPVCACDGGCKCTASEAIAPPAVAHCPGQHGGRRMLPPVAAAPMGETLYEVTVRLVGEGACETGSLCCPKISMPANTYSLMSIAGAEGAPNRAIHVQVCPVDDQTVTLNLKVSMPGKSGEMVRMACSREVALDTVTGIVLQGDGPEPCLAEVRICARQDAPVAPPMPTPPEVCPAPRPAPRFGAGLFLPPPVVPAPMPTPPAAPALPLIVTQASAPMPVPMPLPTPMVMPEPIAAPTLVPPPATVPTVRLVNATASPKSALVRLVREEGKSRLMWKHKDGTTATCVRMQRDLGEGSTVSFAAGKKWVHVEGMTWKAMADRVEVHDDGFLLLSGHVKVHCAKNGKISTLSADRVALKLRRGQIDKALGSMTLPR